MAGTSKSAAGGLGDGWITDAIRETIDGVRARFDQKSGRDAGRSTPRGDVRAAVLALLAEKPQHGYQLIREIGERSGGAWMPSPGAVYPMLQLLCDEGVIRAEGSEGRKTYSLTDEGRAEAESAESGSTPWQPVGGHGAGRVSSLAKAGIDLAQAAAQLARTGSAAQVDQAVVVLDDARRALYALLAQD